MKRTKHRLARLALGGALAAAAFAPASAHAITCGPLRDACRAAFQVCYLTDTGRTVCERIAPL
jgi:hypothetical protein